MAGIDPIFIYFRMSMHNLKFLKKLPAQDTSFPFDVRECPIHNFEQMEIMIKKIEEDAIPPAYGTIHSAGVDFAAYEDCTIPPHGRLNIRTGIAIGWSDPTVYLQLQSRSGLFWRQGVSVEAGVIDWDYLQEIYVLVQNHTGEAVQIQRAQRVAQGIFLQQPQINCWKVVKNWIDQGTLYVPYSITTRSGGMGSTGE